MMRTCDKDDCEQPVKWSLIFRLGETNLDYCELHYTQARHILERWNETVETEGAKR